MNKRQSKKNTKNVNDKYWGLSDNDMDEVRQVAQGTADEDMIKRWYNIYPQIQKKRSGKIKRRMIEAPSDLLKIAQRRIVDEMIYRQSDTSAYAHGFRKRRSAKTAAEVHLGQDIVIAMDVRDFFPNISRTMLLEACNKWCGAKMRTRLDDILDICTINNRLPQGSPASPPLSNLAARTLDNHLAGACRSKWARFTRYADDMVFSASEGCAGCKHSMHRLISGSKRGKTNRIMCDNCYMMGKKLNRVIPWFKDIIQKDHGFPLNNKKLKIMRPGRRQLVNGLVVNKGLPSPRVPREHRHRTRAMLHDSLMSILFDKTPRTKMTVIKGRVEHTRSAYEPHASDFFNMLSLIDECKRDDAKKDETKAMYQTRWAKAA